MMSILNDAKRAAVQFEQMLRDGEKTLDNYRKMLSDTDRNICSYYHVIEHDLDPSVLAHAYEQLRKLLIERRDLKEAITIWTNMTQNVKICSTADQFQKSEARLLKYAKETVEFKKVNGLDDYADPDVTFVKMTFEE